MEPFGLEEGFSHGGGFGGGGFAGAEGGGVEVHYPGEAAG